MNHLILCRTLCHNWRLLALLKAYLRLTREQANGHDAVALTFFPNAGTEGEIAAYVNKIESDRRVARDRLIHLERGWHGRKLIVPF